MQATHRRWSRRLLHRSQQAFRSKFRQVIEIARNDMTADLRVIARAGYVTRKIEGAVNLSRYRELHAEISECGVQLAEVAGCNRDVQRRPLRAQRASRLHS